MPALYVRSVAMTVVVAVALSPVAAGAFDPNLAVTACDRIPASRRWKYTECAETPTDTPPKQQMTPTERLADRAIAAGAYRGTGVTLTLTGALSLVVGLVAVGTVKPQPSPVVLVPGALVLTTGLGFLVASGSPADDARTLGRGIDAQTSTPSRSVVKTVP